MSVLEIHVSKELWLGSCIVFILIIAYSSFWSVQYKCKKDIEIYIQKYAKGISSYSKTLNF